MLVQVLISTMNDRLYDIKFTKEFSYVIVHQITEKYKLLEYKEYIQNIKGEHDVIYFDMFELGLSKSRNMALELSSGDYLWVMDDDTELVPGASKRIVEYFETNEIDFISVRHFMGARLIENCRPNTRVNLVNAAKISSINIVVSRKCINSGLRFNERFGLGSRFPSGEEYIYITDLIKSGFKGKFSDIQGVYHKDELSSGSDFYSNKRLILAKFEMFKKVFPNSYMFWIFLFLIKKFDKFKNNIYPLKAAIRDFND